MHYVYVIHSTTLDRYYVGETGDVEERIKRHNTGFFRNSFTASVDDWILFVSIDCLDRTHARKIESHIKKMKSRKYIRNLKSYPEMISKLKEKYQ